MNIDASFDQIIPSIVQGTQEEYESKQHLIHKYSSSHNKI
jgi:hypothetical protein